MQNYIQCKSKLLWGISGCIKPCLHISSFDTIVFFCCRFYIFGFLGWCWISKYICSRGLLEFIIFGLYAATKSWHAHHKVRLDEFVWKKWVSELLMETFIEVSRKPFENLVLWPLLIFAGILWQYVALLLAIKNSPPPPDCVGQALSIHPPNPRGVGDDKGMWSN